MSDQNILEIIRLRWAVYYLGAPAGLWHSLSDEDVKGADLIAFKAEGLPKLGRRRLSTPTLEKNLNSKNKGEISATLLSPEDTSD